MKLNEKIGLGTVQFGLKYGIANKTGQTPADEVTGILDNAYRCGVRIIDTASAYGDAEKVLGLNELQRFKLVSKFMPATEGQTVTEQLNRTLANLHVSSLHGFLAHRPLNLVENKSQWKELELLKISGKVEKIGYSLNDPAELKELLDQHMIPDIVQVPYNYFDSRFKERLIALKISGCEIHTRSAFLQGLFFVNPESLPPFFDEVKKFIRYLQGEYGDKLPGVLLRYVLKQDFIDSVIIGVENQSQLQENIKKIENAPDLKEFEGKIPDSILMPYRWTQQNN